MKTGGLLSGRINRRFDEQQIVDHRYRVSSCVIYSESDRKYRYAFMKWTLRTCWIPLSAWLSTVASAITLISQIIIIKRFVPSICRPIRNCRAILFRDKRSGRNGLNNFRTSNHEDYADATRTAGLVEPIHFFYVHTYVCTSSISVYLLWWREPRFDSRAFERLNKSCAVGTSNWNCNVTRGINNSRRQAVVMQSHRKIHCYADLKPCQVSPIFFSPLPSGDRESLVPISLAAFQNTPATRYGGVRR